jgi:hypothetical protein
MNDDHHAGFGTEHEPLPSIESVFREDAPRYGYRTPYPDECLPCGYRTADASKGARQRPSLKLVVSNAADPSPSGQNR